MKFLALDTSTDYLTIAIMDGEKVLSRVHKKIGRNHSSLLMPAIAGLLKKTRLKLKDIGGFCVGVGPGSFTGLRIGVVSVKGLAYSLKKPIVAVPTMDAIARNVKNFKCIICPVLDARKNKVYACLYRSNGKGMKKISKYLLIPAKDLMKLLSDHDEVFLLGDAIPLLEGVPDRMPDWHPKADILGRLGAENFRKKKFVSAENLEPLYIYSKECDIKGV